MPLLEDLPGAIGQGKVEVIDLTAPLSESPPIIQLPPPFANMPRDALVVVYNDTSYAPARIGR